MKNYILTKQNESNQMTFKTEVGTDIIEINRFRKKTIEQNKTFYESIFSKSELKHCQKYTDPYPHFAGLFAAKEAVIKSLKPLAMRDIEVFWNDEGKPLIKIQNKQTNNIKISISHSKNIAIAVAFGFFNNLKE